MCYRYMRFVVVVPSSETICRFGTVHSEGDQMFQELSRPAALPTVKRLSTQPLQSQAHKEQAAFSIHAFKFLCLRAWRPGHGVPAGPPVQWRIKGCFDIRQCLHPWDIPE